MIEQLILLTLALSLDSFGIGVSYGIRKINFKINSIFIISTVSLILTGFSVYMGKALATIFSDKIINVFSVLILVVIGLSIIKKSVYDLDNNNNFNNNSNINLDNINTNFNQDFIINIIKNPSLVDLNHSNIIDPIEAIFLGIAISVDALGVGLAVSDFSMAYLFPIFIILFQFLFLFTGMFFGKKLNIKSLKILNLNININENTISLISGSMLILIGGFKIFFY